MSRTLIGRPLRLLGSTLVLATLVLALSANAPQLASAQSQPNQAYDCGTYGAGSYGQNDCVAATDTTPTPTTSPTPIAGGLAPDTGAGLGMWAAFGALIAATGFALFEYNRRQQRLNGGNQ